MQREAVEQGVFARLVAQVEPVLHEVHAQHALQPDLRAAAAGLGVVRLDDAAQLQPRNDLLHRCQEGITPGRLAVPLVLRVVIGGHGEGLLLYDGFNAGGVPGGGSVSVALISISATVVLCRR